MCFFFIFCLAVDRTGHSKATRPSFSFPSFFSFYLLTSSLSSEDTSTRVSGRRSMCRGEEGSEGRGTQRNEKRKRKSHPKPITKEKKKNIFGNNEVAISAPRAARRVVADRQHGFVFFFVGVHLCCCRAVWIQEIPQKRKREVVVRERRIASKSSSPLVRGSSFSFFVPCIP